MTGMLTPARATDPRYYGVVEAIVEDVTGDPAHEGQVRLRFPRFDGGREVSDWCRVAQLYAGNGYGSFFPPEQGDEVLVAFVHGDMRYPIVLGGLYNGVDKPPSDRTDDRNQKLIRTKHGHQVLFDDSGGSEMVRLTTANGHAVALDDRGGNEAVHVTTVKGHALHLDDAQQRIVIETSKGASITLADDGTITVTGKTVKVEAGAIELGSPAAIEPAVLGNTLLALFNAHVHALAPPAPPLPTTPPATPLTPAVLSQKVKVARA